MSAQSFVLNGDCLEVLRTMPDQCIDAVVTDPPYGLSKEPDMAEVVRHWCAAELREHARNLLGRSLSSKESGDALAAVLFPEAVYDHGGSGFMGKSWDSFVPGPEVWREVLRVLKPGGHALVFSGTRTYDLTVLAMRIAGFEIRDQLAWMYGSGFPKSLDVSKAIDACNGNATAWRAFSSAYNDAVKASAYTHADIDRALSIKSSSCYWARLDHRGGMPPRHHWEQVRAMLGLPATFVRLYDEAEREVIGQKRSTQLAVAPGQGAERSGVTLDETAPATPEAAAWSGWGTALKPAQEPIVLARKPLAGTVAANVLAHGTGGINVDGCRIGTEDMSAQWDRTWNDNSGEMGGRYSQAGRDAGKVVPPGRWPANVLFDEAAAAMLDEQTGDVKGQQSGTTGNEPSDRTASVYSRGTARKPTQPRGDTGGASRFYYVAKTSRAEREAGLDHLPKRSAGELTDRTDGSDGLKSPRAGAGRTSEGRANTHPTVKPLALMRWLVRLITPPGGIVLDPYCGSGSTLCAAVQEDVGAAIGIELTPEYVPIIEGRVAYWSAQGAA